MRQLAMTLTAGTILGTYEIVEPIGAGGMGEVYRARDAKLKRDVAIKILPDEFSKDPERVSRFQREAEALAALSHQNMAGIHDLQQSDTTRFLVLELVEGDTLADILSKRGALPIDEALQIAKQICEALEAADEKGIVHRDLKPANIKVTPAGQVKVLDFGLAKALNISATHVDLSNSPTLMSVARTNAGVLIGTAAYMSPEQANGFNTDARSDLFSLGCVLYEMVTGRQVFQGATVSEILASILKSDPDWALLPDRVNPKFRQLLRRSLEKNPKQRWYAAGDIRLEIEAIMDDPYGAKVGAEHVVVMPPRRWSRAIPILVTAIVVAVVSAFVAWNAKSPQTGSVARFAFVLPAGQQLTDGGRHALAISPDGQEIVYVANRQLHLRRFAETDARPIQGAGVDVNTPFFSPDGRWLGFYSVSERKLKKIPIGGGEAITICDADNVYGASWASNNQIFIGQGTKGILRVSANGGKPEVVIKPGSGEIAHGPQLLPGGKTLLFTLAASDGQAGWNAAKIVVQHLDTSERKVLLEGGSDARYLSTGHMVYATDQTLFAVRFNTESLQIHGTGAVERLTTPEKNSRPQPEGWSRDGRTLAFSSQRENGDRGLWMINLDGDKRPKTVIESPYATNDSSVSPDGRWIAYNSAQSGGIDVYVKPFPPTEAQYQVSTGGGSMPVWSPDGKQLFYLKTPRAGKSILVSVDVQTQPSLVFRKMTALPITVVPGARDYDLDPDGKYFAILVPKATSDQAKSPTEQINITLNWFEELVQRIPVH